MAKDNADETYGDIQRKVYGVKPTNYMQKRAAESARENTVDRILSLADRGAKAVERAERKALRVFAQLRKR